MWYVMIGDVETGPLTRVEVGVELASGAISSDTLVWREGMSDWTPGAKVPELAQLFSNPPKRPRATVPGKQQKGMGMSDFDTGHFRLAELAPGDDGKKRDLEFDTAHFRLKDLAPGDDGKKRDLEFDTAHFRLADMPKGGDRLAVPKRIMPGGAPASAPQPPSAAPAKARLQPASTDAVSDPWMDPLPRGARGPARAKGPPPKPPVPPKTAAVSLAQEKTPPMGRTAPIFPLPKAAVPRLAPAPKPVPQEEDEEFDSTRTSVELLPLGERVHQEAVAGSLFTSESSPVPSAHDLSKWAADQLIAQAKAQAEAKKIAEAKAEAARKHPPRTPALPLPATPARRFQTTHMVYAGIGAFAALLAVLYLIFD
jgi:hypothetical protein